MHRRRRRPLTRWLLPALVFVLLVIPGQGLAAGSSSNGAKAPKAEIAHGPLVAPHVFTGNLKDLPRPLVAAGPPHATRDHNVDFGTKKQGPDAPAVPKAAASMPASSTSFKRAAIRS